MTDTKLKKGVKYDAEKLRWDLLPYDALEEVVKILTHGAKKYEDENWKRVTPSKKRYSAALMRHFSKWMQGEKIDPESGNDKLRHIAQVVCNGLFLLWEEINENTARP